MSASGRPVFLNILKIQMPVAAVLSVLHRISGIILLLMLPALLYWLQLSVSSQVGFQSAFNWFNGMTGRIILFMLLWGLLHHLFSGIRFLLIDIDQGVDKHTARLTAWMVLLLAPCVSLFLLWLT